MKEQEMFEAVMDENEDNNLSKEQEIFLRKLIRKDIRQVLKMEREADRESRHKEGDFSDGGNDSDSWLDEGNMRRRIEEKVHFGSDSEKDIDEMVNRKY